jgi:hypothetical protein
MSEEDDDTRASDQALRSWTWEVTRHSELDLRVCPRIRTRAEANSVHGGPTAPARVCLFHE